MEMKKKYKHFSLKIQAFIIEVSPYLFHKEYSKKVFNVLESTNVFYSEASACIDAFLYCFRSLYSSRYIGCRGDIDKKTLFRFFRVFHLKFLFPDWVIKNLINNVLPNNFRKQEFSYLLCILEIYKSFIALCCEFKQDEIFYPKLFLMKKMSEESSIAFTTMFFSPVNELNVERSVKFFNEKINEFNLEWSLKFFNEKLLDRDVKGVLFKNSTQSKIETHSLTANLTHSEVVLPHSEIEKKYRIKPLLLFAAGIFFLPFARSAFATTQIPQNRTTISMSNIPHTAKSAHTFQTEKKYTASGMEKKKNGLEGFLITYYSTKCISAQSSKKSCYFRWGCENSEKLQGRISSCCW